MSLPPSAPTQQQRGLLWAACAYGLWGILPLYWKTLASLPAWEVLRHRSFWAAFFGVLICLFSSQIRKALREALNVKILPLIGLGSLFVGCNWFIYIWAVNSGHVIETSLGYFMNPILNVLAGTLILGERLRPFQWLAITIAFTGVALMVGFYGAFPWISVCLATSFALYGIVKKKTPGSSMANLTIESLILSGILALLLFFLKSPEESPSFFLLPGKMQMLLVFSGLLTAFPLFCFGKAARILPLTILGFMQYLAPVLQLCLGIWVFKEEFSSQDMTAFGFIWLALIVFSVEGFMQFRLRSAGTRASA